MSGSSSHHSSSRQHEEHRHRSRSPIRQGRKSPSVRQNHESPTARQEHRSPSVRPNINSHHNIDAQKKVTGRDAIERNSRERQDSVMCRSPSKHDKHSLNREIDSNRTPRDNDHKRSRSRSPRSCQTSNDGRIVNSRDHSRMFSEHSRHSSHSTGGSTLHNLPQSAVLATNHNLPQSAVLATNHNLPQSAVLATNHYADGDRSFSRQSSLSTITDSHLVQPDPHRLMFGLPDVFPGLPKTNFNMRDASRDPLAYIGHVAPSNPGKLPT